MQDDVEKDIIIAINDNVQDGIDISWLWDVDFDKRMRRYSENFKILRQQKYEESVRRRAAKAV